VGRAGVCLRCYRARQKAQSGVAGWRISLCRRCGWKGAVPRDGTCLACLLAIRMGEDDEWLWAEIRHETLPPGRSRQLVLGLPGLKLPEARPVRGHEVRRRGVPKWVRARFPVPVRDDPRICPVQVPGQLGLFPSPRRSFTLSQSWRISDRDIPELPRAVAELRKIADERGVRARYQWLHRVEGIARLALAARPPDQHKVPRALLKDLLYHGPTVGVALGRAGLCDERPRPGPRAPQLNAPRHGHGKTDEMLVGSCASCMAWGNDRRVMCQHCRNWHSRHRRGGATEGECTRCRRIVLVVEGLCRFCHVVLRETEVDFAGVALDGGDQLWFAGALAPALAIPQQFLGHRELGRTAVRSSGGWRAYVSKRPSAPRSTSLTHGSGSSSPSQSGTGPG
jgi:hypothetical protein